MKQLLLAAAVTLSLATIPAIADSTGNTIFTVGPTVAGHTPDDAHTFATLCQHSVVIDNDTGGSITVLIKVETQHSAPGVTGGWTIAGGEPAKITCNKDVDTVQPGNFFVCKTKKDITIQDAFVPSQGSDLGVRGYFVTKD